MTDKKKTTSDAVEILYNRYIGNDPKRIAEYEKVKKRLAAEDEKTMKAIEVTTEALKRGKFVTFDGKDASFEK